MPSKPSRMIKQSPFKYFKTSPEVIRLAVMMYVRFPLSLRNVEDLLHERGIEVSHETVRHWWSRFGPMFAAEVSRKRVQKLRAFSEWKWHVDEFFMKVNGKRHYLWRAVDHEGEVLDAVVTKCRNKAAALKFLKKLMKRRGKAENVVTDRFASYRAYAKFAEVRRCPFLCLQPLQPGKIAHQPRHLQADTHRRSRRVARTWCGIKGSDIGLADTGSNSPDSTLLNVSNAGRMNHISNSCTVSNRRASKWERGLVRL
ncbi:Transposase IS66 family protein [Ruegeria atlantica]|uniref:Transposase IS66 family protein n=1 Tax=Ruegeria atlantica TaxID=81569 RepID=A0A0P1E724_9RHOB|nr:Transposase IS66 family protein [Ruegeria atlantica]